MTIKTPNNSRKVRAREIKAWRMEEGLSVQDVVDRVNISSGKAILSNAQVTAWEAKGNAPEPEAVAAVRVYWKNFPA